MLKLGIVVAVALVITAIVYGTLQAHEKFTTEMPEEVLLSFEVAHDLCPALSDDAAVVEFQARQPALSGADGVRWPWIVRWPCMEGRR